jgi:alkylhydroperoxidase family enzyme
MHTRDLIKKGVKVEKLALVQTWKAGGSLFSETERPALVWAESVTRVAEIGVPDSAYRLSSKIEPTRYVDLEYRKIC